MAKWSLQNSIVKIAKSEDKVSQVPVKAASFRPT